VASSRPIGIHYGQAAQTKLPDARLPVVLHLLEHLRHVGQAKLARRVPVNLPKTASADDPIFLGDLLPRRRRLRRRGVVSMQRAHHCNSRHHDQTAFLGGRKQARHRGLPVLLSALERP
jgi:hypothetical protein